MTSPGAKGPGAAREIAAAVLVRVWEEDAFAAAALDAEIRRRPQVDPRDLGLATELVYGVLRTGPYLDETIERLSSRRTRVADARVRAHVSMGAYSILFLDRIPPFAAVSAAVEGARAAADDRVGGFVNAVLRRLAGEVQEGASARPALVDAIAASAPGWLRGALRRSIGRAGATAYLAAGPVPPPIGICLANDQSQSSWISRLKEAAPGAEIEAGRVSPRAILIRGAGDVRRMPGAGDAWIVQEEGAQVIALAAGARRGDRVLDACAGRGNKTWILGQEVGPEGAVDASDLYPAKIEKLRSGPPGKWVRETFAVDWTAGVGDVPEGYDRVIVDAPCSGTGTLRRRPEIGGKREADDLARLSDLQLAIARRAATRVRDGGILVFAVCSVLREECEDVVARLVAGDPDEPATKLEPAPFEGEVAAAVAGGGHTLRLLPHVHGTDGYFAASLRVRR